MKTTEFYKLVGQVNGLLIMCILIPAIVQFLIKYTGLAQYNNVKTNMTIGLSICNNFLEQGLTLIKSMVVFSHNANLDLRIFYDDMNYEHLMRELPVLKNEATTFWNVTLSYRLYHYSFPNNDHDYWYQLYRPCATQRLFFPEILTDVDALLYVDADIVFLSDVTDIWTYLPRMNATQIMAMTPHDQRPNPGHYNEMDQNKFPYYPPKGLQDGVILMNLALMRDINFTQQLIPITGKYIQNMTLGDQDILNVYFYFHPDQVHLVSCRFNFYWPYCQNPMGRSPCRQAEKSGISILHGSNFQFTSDSNLPFFRTMYLIFQEMNLSTTKIVDIQQKIHGVYQQRFKWSTNIINCAVLRKGAYSRIDKYVHKNQLVPTENWF